MTASAAAMPADTDSLVLTRPYNGIGDWLFCLAVLNFVQRQSPATRRFVDFSLPPSGRPLPALVPEAFAASTVDFVELDRGRRRSKAPRARPGGSYHETRDSLVYRAWPPDCYIESTVMHLNQQTGLGIAYERGVYPDFGRRHRPGGDTVVMIGHGKRRHRHGKEWGFVNFNRLASRLARAGVPVVQVGAADDGRLEKADRHVLGAPFSTVADLLCRARAFVGIENGLMVLAGFLGVPQVTIYDGSRGVSRTSFVGQTKIAGRVEADAAFQQVMEVMP